MNEMPRYPIGFTRARKREDQIEIKRYASDRQKR